VVRFLVLALLAVLVYVGLRAALAGLMAGVRGQVRGGAPARSARDELVKDPVCETYVPRQTAVARTAGAATYYFCGPGCAAKFKTPS
jgi:YHS domain-containing protein